ncbi:MAG TPA: helix-turn-helix domain-containing protein [Bryobacteraceae bacterium]|jgi:DNA-binding transcriptional MerR regulator
MDDSRTLAELSETSGVPARTIRFYISRGLLEGPVKAGRGAVYTGQHLARLEQIKKLQNEGRMLSQIGRDLAAGQPEPSAAPPTAWWQHVIAEDVVVWVRADVSPWRMKQIRSAIDQLAAVTRNPKEESE